ncbi:tetratricopeptide repeat protein [Kitasatospora sp. NPDC057015]|uniref:tetratricopeptide repeat protein n=1 Tax=Kitasatospora sp. NPDC057015 TaxID=3346001 RepID=UPI00362EB8F7
MTADETQPTGIRQDASASDQGHVYQAGRDLHIMKITRMRSQRPPAPAALPAGPEHLVGRQAEVDELLAALAPDHVRAARWGRTPESTGEVPGGSATVVVSAVAGLAGIGKTALALHTAHEAVARGMFPGGVLFVTLRGYDPAGPVSTERALGALLRQLGTSGDDLPGELEELAALYQSELTGRAHEAGAVMIVADDASSTAQLTALIPAHRAHRLLVTSRNTLTSPTLRARLVRLEELDATAAAELIREAVALVLPGDRRCTAEPEALAEVVAHCGRLPLALQIAAALLISDPGLSVATLAGDLAGTLDSLQFHDTSGQLLAVRAAFDLSHQRLAPEPARVFGLLGLCVGPDLSTESAAALTDRPVRETRRTLAAVAAAGLLTEHPVGSGRWRMHDLIRLYTAELADPRTEESRAALDRLLRRYTDLTAAAADHLKALPGDPPPAHFDDRHQALAWLDAEHPILVATTTRHLPAALALAFHLHGFLLVRRHFDDAITIAEHSVTTTRDQGDRHHEGRALNNLGLALREVRRFQDAIDSHTRAAAIFTDLGDRHREGRALSNLGNAMREVRRYPDAIDSHTRAVAIFADLGDRRREGVALNNLGAALREVRRFQDAIDAHTRAAAIFTALGDRHREGQALGNLGNALREVRSFREAIHAHTRAVAVFADLGDRQREGVALNNLGAALREVRRFQDAIDAHTRAAAICRDLGDRHREGQALNNLGLALREVRRFREAIDAHTRAATICRELGDRHGEGQVLNNLGTVLQDVGSFEDAVDAHTGALAICRDLGDRHAEGQALNNLGLALQAVRRFQEAVDAHTRALTICRDLGNRHAEGTALTNLGNALPEVGRFESAVDAHTRALTICRDLGDRHREGTVLNNLGNALQDVGRFEDAIDAHTRAAATLADLGDRHGEGQALNNLGNALQDVGRFEDAVDALGQAATIFTDLGDRHREGVARTNLGLTLQDAGRFEDAIDAHTRAAAIFTDLGDRHRGDHAQWHLADALAEAGRAGGWWRRIRARWRRS